MMNIDLELRMWSQYILFLRGSEKRVYIDAVMRVSPLITGAAGVNNHSLYFNSISVYSSQYKI
jgi:hypothetical protein